MPAPESLADLAAELRAMSPRARRQILAELSDSERQALDPIIDDAAAVPQPAGDAVPAPIFSPWLAQSIAAARAGNAGAVTAATRAALLKSADAIERPATSIASRAGVKDPGRSLMNAFGGMLPARRGR